MIEAQSIDHLVLTVADIERSVSFYSQVLGMKRIEFGEGRVALAFGNQKINLHPKGDEVKPHANLPTTGSADLCIIVSQSVDVVQAELERQGVVPELGPVKRTGASGEIESIYVRDPDKNLVEIARYVEG